MASDHRPLGPLDHISPHNIPQSVMYFSLKRGVKAVDAFAHLQEGLRRTLLQVPWLSGSVHWQRPETPGWRPGKLELRHGKSGSALLRFKELATSKSYTNLRDTGFPLNAFSDEDMIWTKPWNPDYEIGVPVFAAQANFLPGGCFLAFSIACQIADGTAMLMIIKIWADYCSSLSQTLNDDPIKVLPRETFDRDNLDEVLARERGTPERAPAESKEARQLIGLFPEQKSQVGDSSAAVGVNMKHTIFYMPHKAYMALLKQCVAEFGNTHIAGNDLISALIWRSLMRAWVATKSNDVSEPISELLRPFDARPNFAQSFKTMYLGTLNFENRTIMPLRTLVSQDTSIASVANTIRAAVGSQASQENLLEAYALLRDAPDYNQVQWRATHTSGSSVGVLSPMILPFNDTCFGKDIFGNEGKPDAFRPIMGACNRGYRTCFVIPRKKHGGLEFVMTLSEEEMNFLEDDIEFSRYAFPIGLP
ncbi:transferase [Xylaria cubensis]|nr:transferase [Xylaria cubensis]